MTMTAALLLDIALGTLLVFFFIRGVRRGLILMLCSLLAIFLAVFGGWYLSHHYDGALQEKLEPFIYEHMLEKNRKASGSQQEGMDAQQQTMIQSQSAAIAETVIAQKSASLASSFARALLFLGGFVLVLLLWTLFCHALDLVARLPGLHFLNKFLGGLLGLVNGCILLLVCRWVLCDLLDLIPAQAAADSYILAFLSRIPFSSLLGI